MTKLMEKALTRIQTELLMLATGMKISNTVLELKNGLMEPSMKVSIKMERRMEREN